MPVSVKKDIMILLEMETVLVSNVILLALHALDLLLILAINVPLAMDLMELNVSNVIFLAAFVMVQLPINAMYALQGNFCSIARLVKTQRFAFHP